MATVITNVTELQAMENYLTLDYELGNDIDASATSTWNGGLGFDPIGDATTKFSGSFDGKGFTITGLFINRPTEDYNGLFGYVITSGDIKDVGIADCNITGQRYTAALMGRQSDIGTLSNCWSSGAITGVDYYIAGLIGYCYASNTNPITNCYSTCTVTVVATGATADATECGGLIGSLFTLEVAISNCYATGNITATSGDMANRIGGFIGYISGDNVTINQCYATGNISITAVDDGELIGGFIGDAYSTGTISNCYARGSVTVSTDDPVNSNGVGGFAGHVGTNQTIDDCYSTGAITVTVGFGDVGGFCGTNDGTITNCFWDTQTSLYATSNGGTGKTTAQMKTKATFTDAGWNFITIWNIDGVTNDGYPFLDPRVAPLARSHVYIIG